MCNEHKDTAKMLDRDLAALANGMTRAEYDARYPREPDPENRMDRENLAVRIVEAIRPLVRSCNWEEPHTREAVTVRVVLRELAAVRSVVPPKGSDAT